MWAEQGDETARTPGNSVGGELVFARQLSLRIGRDGGEVDISLDAPPSPQKASRGAAGTATGTPLPRAVGGLRQSLGESTVPIYSSPAFAKRMRLSGDSFLDSAYDPFLEHDADEGIKKDLRSSFSGVGQWRYATRSPSPVKDVQHFDLEVELERPDAGDVQVSDIEMLDQVHEENVQKELPTTPDQIFSSPKTRSPIAAAEPPQPPAPDGVTIGDMPGVQQQVSQLFADMPPPPLSKLRMPETSRIGEEAAARNSPTTPELRAVPNSALPLPSPFPVEGAQPSLRHPDLTSPTLRVPVRSVENGQEVDQIGDPQPQKDPERQGSQPRSGIDGTFKIPFEKSSEEQSHAFSLMRDAGQNVDSSAQAPSSQNQTKVAHMFQSESRMQAPPRPVASTPVKLPPSTFSLDGEGSSASLHPVTPAPQAKSTPQSTPQSQRERVMSQTYKSLFGFRTSPEPQPSPTVHEEPPEKRNEPVLGWTDTAPSRFDDVFPVAIKRRLKSPMKEPEIAETQFPDRVDDAISSPPRVQEKVQRERIADETEPTDELAFADVDRDGSKQDRAPPKAARNSQESEADILATQHHESFRRPEEAAGAAVHDHLKQTQRPSALQINEKQAAPDATVIDLDSNSDVVIEEIQLPENAIDRISPGTGYRSATSSDHVDERSTAIDVSRPLPTSQLNELAAQVGYDAGTSIEPEVASSPPAAEQTESSPTPQPQSMLQNQPTLSEQLNQGGSVHFPATEQVIGDSQDGFLGSLSTQPTPAAAESEGGEEEHEVDDVTQNEPSPARPIDTTDLEESATLQGNGTDTLAQLIQAEMDQEMEDAANLDKSIDGAMLHEIGVQQEATSTEDDDRDLAETLSSPRYSAHAEVRSAADTDVEMSTHVHDDFDGDDSPKDISRDETQESLQTSSSVASRTPSSASASLPTADKVSQKPSSVAQTEVIEIGSSSPASAETVPSPITAESLEPTFESQNVPAENRTTLRTASTPDVEQAVVGMKLSDPVTQVRIIDQSPGAQNLLSFDTTRPTDQVSEIARAANSTLYQDKSQTINELDAATELKDLVSAEEDTRQETDDSMMPEASQHFSTQSPISNLPDMSTSAVRPGATAEPESWLQEISPALTQETSQQFETQIPISDVPDVSYPTLPLSPLASQPRFESQAIQKEQTLDNEQSKDGLPLTPQLTQAASNDKTNQKQPEIQEQPLDSASTQGDLIPGRMLGTLESNGGVLEMPEQNLTLAHQARAAHKQPTSSGGEQEQAPEVVESHKVEQDASPGPKKKTTPARKSFGSRLSGVPDVISAWFSPKRSSTAAIETPNTPPQTENEQVHLRSTHFAAEQVGKGAVRDVQEGDAVGPPETPSLKKTPSSGIVTSTGYYTPLPRLEEHLNSSSQQGSNANTVDVLAVVVNSTKPPERAKGGPRDYYTIFRIAEPSTTSQSSVRVEVFRPWKAKLPVAEVGDVVLLRDFTVKSRQRQPYLLSTDTSAWCVWRHGSTQATQSFVDQPGWALQRSSGASSSHSSVREEVKGPPVELGDDERKHAKVLRESWLVMHSEGNKQQVGEEMDGDVDGLVSPDLTARL